MSSNNTSRKQKVPQSSPHTGTGSKPSRSKTPQRTGSSSTTPSTNSNGRTNSQSKQQQQQQQQRNKHLKSPSLGPMNPYDESTTNSMEKMKQFCMDKSNEELELSLKRLLQEKSYEDGAYLITCSSYLEAKFKTSDVIRLMLEDKSFDRAGNLIRELKMQSNQLLVMLFIKELIRHNQFISAVKYAQEMVTNFGKKDFTYSRDTTKPSWTPQALIQAMIRAQNYRYALKYAKQFELLEIFPPEPLITSMLESKQWEDAISAIMEYRQFDQFPLEKLVLQMLAHRQWNLAMKCIHKISSTSNADTNKFIDLLVREASRAGHFLIALKYMREFKLDQSVDEDQRPNELVRFFMIQLIQFAEYYKAIKYARKFGLSKTDPAIFGTEKMILQAMEHGQYHVASSYIKKLQLKEQFASQLAEIQARRQQMTKDFRAFVRMREQQQLDPQVQFAWIELMQASGYDEQKEQYMEVSFEQDAILEEQTEILPSKTEDQAEELKVQEDQEVHMRLRRFSEDSMPSISKPSSGPVAGQSRFDFARFGPSIENSPADDITGGAVHATSSPRATQPSMLDLDNSTGNAQRVLVPPSLPPGLSFDAEGGEGGRNDSNAFDFSRFASNLQQTESMASMPRSAHSPRKADQGPQLVPPPQSLSGLQPSGLQQGSFSPPQPPAPQSFAPPPPPLPPTPPAPSSLPTGYFLHPMQQKQQQHVQHQHFQPPQQQQRPIPTMPQNLPPPPPPPSVALSSSNFSSGGTFDIASLAMQFHKPSQASGSPAPGSFSFRPGHSMPPPGPPMNPPPPHFHPGYMHGVPQPMPMHHQPMQPPVRSSFTAVPPPSIGRQKR